MTTLYLRNQKNQTLVDIEIMSNSKVVSDIHAVVYIENYSRFLVEHLEDKDYVILRFDNLAELRGWFFESYLHENKEPRFLEVQQAIIDDYQDLIERYKFCWVID